MSSQPRIQLTFSNPEIIQENDLSNIQNILNKIETPYFAQYQTDITNIQKIGQLFLNKKNLIIAGNGGSISTFRAFVECFGKNSIQPIYLLDTDDSNYLAYLKQQCHPKETLMVMVSKSGNSIQSITNYLAMLEYEMIFVTSNTGTLYEIAQIKNIPIINHPNISGRFSGITESALFPAYLANMNINEISQGAHETYQICHPQSPLQNNPALQLAMYLDRLEQKNYTEIFLSIYSKQLTGFFELIVQLFHESVCKGNKGQTFYGGEAPENQHHTLQRFNSGRQNTLGIFMTVKNLNDDIKCTVENDIKHLVANKTSLEKFHSISMQTIINTEFQGTWQDTLQKQIPAVQIEIADLSPKNIGAVTAFWQYCAFYSAILRNVEPFTQPGVEQSKEYMFNIIQQLS